MTIQQLPLNIYLQDDATFANFWRGDNEQLISTLNTFCETGEPPYIYIAGSRASGKSHLLQACCHALSLQQYSMYLPLKEIMHFSVDILQDVETLDLIALDDIETIIGNKVWEEAIFHLYNRLRASKTRLLIAGETLPLQLTGLLPDLHSRLNWGLTFQLHPLTDEQKLFALKMRAEQRGLTLNDEVAYYLLRHYVRDMASLFATLETLDRASMVAQRKLTVPFVKATLGTVV